MKQVGTEVLTIENVDDCFTYHQWDAEQMQAGTEVRAALIHAARVILNTVPPCPDRSVALRKLREARMDANSAITHRGRF